MDLPVHALFKKYLSIVGTLLNARQYLIGRYLCIYQSMRFFKKYLSMVGTLSCVRQYLQSDCTIITNP